MPRPLRVEYPGTIQHFMSRGDHREGIFRDDADRRAHQETDEPHAARLVQEWLEAEECCGQECARAVRFFVAPRRVLRFHPGL